MKPIRLFILLLIVGTIGIVFGIFLPRNISSVAYPAIWASIIVFVVSFLIIFLYTAIVSQNKIILTQDSADYAYYLGFTLTIVSLVIVFMSDGIFLLLNKVYQSSDIKGGVKSILMQFGAGLSATMVGVVARIYLIDLLAQSDVPADESIRKVRYEMNELVHELRMQTSLYVSTIGEGMNSFINEIKMIQDASNGIVIAINNTGSELSKSLTDAADSIKRAYDISETENNMKGIAGKLRKMLKAISDASEALMSNVGNINESLNGLKTSTDLSGKTLELFSSNIENLNDKLHQSNLVMATMVDSLSNGSQIINNFCDDAKKINSSFSVIDESFNILKPKLNIFSSNIGKVNDSLNNLAMTSSAGSVSVQGFSENLKQAEKDSNLLSEGIKSLIAMINKIENDGTGASESLSKVNDSLNNLAMTSSAGSVSVQGFSENLKQAEKDSNLLSEGIKSLIAMINKIENDGTGASESLSKVNDSLNNLAMTSSAGSVSVQGFSENLKQAEKDSNLLSEGIKSLIAMINKIENDGTGASESLSKVGFTMKGLEMNIGSFNNKLNEINGELNQITANIAHIASGLKNHMQGI